MDCRQRETALVFDAPVQHLFALFDAKIFPRGMYSKLRKFIGKLHGTSFERVMSAEDKSWAIPGNTSDCSVAERDTLLPDFQYMGAFMW